MQANRLVEIVFFWIMFLICGVTYAEPHVEGSDAPVVSVEQVKKAIKKRHKGSILSVKAKPTSQRPNCHVVKMSTPTGGIKYIRYACQ